jgi:hypothetical protein
LRCDNAEAHSITIPKHSPLKVGTLAAIIGDVADKRGMTRERLLDELFG